MLNYSNEELLNASKHLDWRLQFNKQNRYLCAGKGNSEDKKKVNIDLKSQPWTEELVGGGEVFVICFSLLKQFHFQCRSSENVVPCSGITSVTQYAAKLAQTVASVGICEVMKTWVQQILLCNSETTCGIFFRVMCWEWRRSHYECDQTWVVALLYVVVKMCFLTH